MRRVRVERLMTGRDREHGIAPVRVLARETARCVRGMALGVRFGRGTSRVTLPWWLARRFAGLLGTPLDGTRMLTFRIALPGGPARVRVRRNQSDLLILWEVLLCRAYDLESAFGVDMPARLDTVVDLGAHTGLASMWLAARYHPRLLVAVEPVAANVEVLQRNWPRAAERRIERAAVAGRCGTAEVHVSGVWDSCTTHGEVVRARGAEPHRLEPLLPRPAESVPALSVAALLDRHGITGVDLLKVDVEGAEADVFARVQPWMARVECIVAEIHDKYVDGDRVRATLAAAGFERVEARAVTGVVDTPNRTELFVRR